MKRLLLVVAAPISVFVSAGANPSVAQSVITIVSPYTGEFVGQSPYYVRWTASGIAGNALFLVHYVDGSGEAREICEAPPSARECLWSEPDWFATTLFVTAVSSSGATLTTAQSGRFFIQAENLPPQFTSHLDIGNVGRSGAAWGHGPDAVSVGGAGADIWGTADAFHFAYMPLHGGAFDSSFTITEVDGAQPWTKVGVMARDNATPGAPHHSLFVTRENGVAYQRRLTQNGPSLHTSVSASEAVPVQVMVMRRGSDVVMDIRHGSGAWQRVAEFRIESTLMLGMAVTSHDATNFATGDFADVSSRYTEPTVQILSPAGGDVITVGTPYTISWMHAQPVNIATVSYSVDNGQTWTGIPGCASITVTTCRWNNPGPVTQSASIRVVIEDPNDRTAWNVSDYVAIRAQTEGALPAGWVTGDVGAVSAPGSASYEAGRFAVAGSGADIWGKADEFSYVSRTVYDDGEFGTDITARVASIENVNAWTKVGLMLRAHRGAGAAHLSLFVTPTTVKGIALQRRPTENGTSLHTPGPSMTGPVWLKFVVKNGHARTYYRKLATDPWTFVAEQSDALAAPYEAGLAVSSHVNGTLAHAAFDNVSITSRDFSHADIGAVVAPGATTTNDLTRTLWGSGADIWGTADAFRFHYRPMETMAVVSARVSSLQPTDPWAKAGVMIRQDVKSCGDVRAQRDIEPPNLPPRHAVVRRFAEHAPAQPREPEPHGRGTRHNRDVRAGPASGSAILHRDPLAGPFGDRAPTSGARRTPSAFTTGVVNRIVSCWSLVSPASPLYPVFGRYWATSGLRHALRES